MSAMRRSVPYGLEPLEKLYLHVLKKREAGFRIYRRKINCGCGNEEECERIYLKFKNRCTSDVVYLFGFSKPCCSYLSSDCYEMFSETMNGGFGSWQVLERGMKEPGHYPVSEQTIEIMFLRVIYLRSGVAPAVLSLGSRTELSSRVVHSSLVSSRPTIPVRKAKKLGAVLRDSLEEKLRFSF